MRIYGKLREKIKKIFGNQKAFAVAMGMNASTLNSKLNGKTDWGMREVEKACMLLNISLDEMREYFFYS